MNFPYAVSMVIILLGLYCILRKRNLIKIILGMGVLADGVNLFFISLGYRAGGISPVLTEERIEHFSAFTAAAVDPLPQALVLTAIVINMSIAAFALALAVKIYQRFGTLDMRKIRRLHG
ncbi:cation:proton antiporter subunit C [Candidatus Hecatella orcuttiae]|uniref:sodium:proton antiporter n=1 Tax=Candidatus Hecatella orcuttiae TaxID=1935119 RepID=UPI002867C9CE|nr:cation:proton antiporter subunit C [Candidatus Hecatella orcuttiae]